MLDRQSALAAALRQPGRSGSDGNRALRLGEVRGWNLVQVAAFASTAAELERVVSAALGVASLPRQDRQGGRSRRPAHLQDRTGAVLGHRTRRRIT